MSLSISTFGDNTSAPFARAEAYIPDQLVAGRFNLVTQPIYLASGTLKRGTVLGQLTSYSVLTAAGTNAGNGTIGSVSPGSAAKLGVYTLTATAATLFEVTDPEGNILAAEATVGTAYASADINFTLTVGATAFVAGDSFKVTVENSIGNFIECVKTATDGSQVPAAILADDADASLGPVGTLAYVAGEFNARALIFDVSWTIPTVRTALRSLSMFVKSSVSAADPS